MKKNGKEFMSQSVKMQKNYYEQIEKKKKPEEISKKQLCGIVALECDHINSCVCIQMMPYTSGDQQILFLKF